MSWYPAFLRPFSCSCTRIRLVRHWGSGWEREACVAKLGTHIMKSGGGGETRRNGTMSIGLQICTEWMCTLSNICFEPRRHLLAWMFSHMLAWKLSPMLAWMLRHLLAWRLRHLLASMKATPPATWMLHHLLACCVTRSQQCPRGRRGWERTPFARRTTNGGARPRTPPHRVPGDPHPECGAPESRTQRCW